MNLPRELYDEILSHLPSDDRRSFQNCSLVAKSWVNPSRRRLFETVDIRASTSRAWRVNIPPADGGYFQQVDLALDLWIYSIPPPTSVLLKRFRWLLQLWWAIFPPRGHVRERPRPTLAEYCRSLLQLLRGLIPPAEDGLLHYIRSLLQSLRDSIPPEDVGLLRHVRSLSYTAGSIRRECFSEVLRNYFPSFHQLRHLSLSSSRLSSSIPQDVGMFSAFRYTLSRLSLTSCVFRVDTLVSLIDYFPNLNHLDLIRPVPPVDGGPARPLSRPLLGQLHVSEMYEERFGIFDHLSTAGLAFDEIVFDGFSPVTLPTLERIVSTVGVRVKHLRLSKPLEACAYITLQTEPSARIANRKTAFL